MVWRASDPEGDEAAKVKYDVVRYTRGAVLDFGCGPNKAFPTWLGVDSCKDTELFGIEMHPNLKVDLGDPAAIAAAFQTESVDAIFSSHTLEHIEDHFAR
jgi:predicted SAM-dependent methyltransferase